MSDFAGRVALVTGAARPQGIGRATALRLAADGADVACVDVGRPPEHASEHGIGTVEDLEETAEQVRDLGRRAITVDADVRRREDVERAVAQTVEELGGLHVVANVAGGVGPGNGLAPLLDLPDDQWDWVVDVNLRGAWLVAVTAGCHLRDHGGGCIVLVGSEAGVRAQRGFGAYGAAKAGVHMLTRVLAAELGPAGVRVNAVAPGMVATQASAPVRADLERRGRLERLRRQIPLQRFADPEEIAAAISALCCGDLSYVTGAVVDASGGHAL